ncbi:MAG: hypothetical protein M3Y41_17480 [Pseudomonadota bacterium]|nr:hypothetical protein [Pseudomonadota bacterium]
MDAIASMATEAGIRPAIALSVRTGSADHARMKRKPDPTKPSPTLAAVLKHWKTPKPDKRLERALAQIPRYPHNRRAEVFCWLWVNHAVVVELLDQWRYSWLEIADIAEQDGVKGRYGLVPTGNAMRRVWGRVCPENEAKGARRSPR